MVSIEEEMSEEDESRGLYRTLKSLAPPIIGTFFIWLYYRETFACTANATGLIGTCWPLWQLWGLIFFLGWWSALAVEKDLKLGTMKIIWTDGHSTTTGRMWPAGDFFIVRAGGLRWRGFEHEGGEGLLIFHKTCLNKLGRQIAITARLKPTAFKSLPKPVRDSILAFGFTKLRPYRYGLIDPHRYRYDKLLKLDPKLAAKILGKVGGLQELPPELFSTLLDEGNKTSYTFEKLADKALAKLESQGEAISRINTQQNHWNSISRFVRGKEKDED